MYYDPVLLHRRMSAADFASFGAPETAFVKRVVEGGQTAWSIHAADGTPMGVASSRELAFAALIQNELDPVSVH